MIASTSLNTESIHLLKVRGLSDLQVNNFSDLLDKAHMQQQQQNISAKQALSNMSYDELKLLQKATSLANAIEVDSLSKEAAMNLLAQPDHSDMVDINNDGLVEVGASKLMIFPPVNAPAKVQVAWDKATEGLTEGIN